MRITPILTAAAASLSAAPHPVSAKWQNHGTRNAADMYPDGLPVGGGDGPHNTDNIPIPGTMTEAIAEAVPVDVPVDVTSPSSSQPVVSQVPPAQAAVCTAADAAGCADVARLGTSLFASLTTSNSNNNVLISPLSIAQALALVSAGATPASACEGELLGALGSTSHEGVPMLTRSILASFLRGSEQSDEDGGVKLTTASSIWLHDSIKATYEERAEIVHHATARPLPKIYEPMNEWVELATDGMVKDLFDGQEALDPLMRAALLNAVYFRGTWTHQFDKDKTEVGVFYKRLEDSASEGEGEKEKVVKFMKSKRHVMLHPSRSELGGATIIKLDYGEVRQDPDRGWDMPADFAALFVLPAEDTVESEQAAIDGMANLSVKELLKGMFPREVNLSLPKFKLEWGTTSVKESLRALGINQAFDGKKVLLGMSDDPDLHLDDVLHKAVMEVTEEGTTAAAATAAMIMTRSVPPPPMDVDFDRPFAVMVVHVPTGTPLFVGRVADPNLSFEEDGVE